jgi:hypothetical protein
MNNAMTLADLLSDLRAVDAGYPTALDGSRALRANELDGAAELVELGWAWLSGCRIRATDAGLDVLFATRFVALDEAA